MGAIYALFFFVVLAALLLLFYGPWQNLCVAWSRQLMFEERDKLFLLAAEGRISVYSAIYRQMRTQIERTIRFCHMITWPRFLVLRHSFDLIGDTKTEERMDMLYRAIQSVDDQTARARLELIVKHMSFASVVCMMGRSAFLGLVFLLLYFGRWLRDYKSDSRVEQFYRTVQHGADRYSRAPHLHHKTPAHA